MNKTCCQLNVLPKDFPLYTTVWSFYHRAIANGIWKLITKALAETERVKSGRSSQPSYALIDSQNAKTADASEERGIDGEKKVKGSIATNISGNFLRVIVHADNIHDIVAGCHVFDKVLARYSTLKGECGDGGCKGAFKEYLESLGKTVVISERIKPGGEILPKRWRVERSFAWANNYLRLSEDYGISIDSEEALFHISFSSVLLKPLFSCV